MATKSICGVAQHISHFTTTNGLDAVSRAAARRFLSTAASSLSNGERPTSNSGSRLDVNISAPNCVQRISPRLKPLEADWTVPRDSLVRAEKGTEKIVSYLIPAIESRLGGIERHAVTNVELKNSSEIPNRARHAYLRGTVGPLVLAATRELAVRIASIAQRLTVDRDCFEVQLLSEGADKDQQKKDWVTSSRDLVVTTPGRLRDLLTNEPEFQRDFKSCPMLILDEADTLLSLGFRDDINVLVTFLPRFPQRQTTVVTATVSRAVRQLASWILSPDHTFVNTMSRTSTPCRDDGHATHEHIQQFYTLCPAASDQIPTLLKMLAHDQLTHGSKSKVVIFCATSQATDLFSMVLRSLAGDALPSSTEILKRHLKMKRSDSERALALFREAGTARNGRPTLLVTSDTSLSGVNYRHVTRMIQIGIPYKETVYTQRLWRMSRARHGNVAVRADLLLLPWEAGYMDWRLTDLPITSCPVSTLDAQLASLSPQPSTEFSKSALAGNHCGIGPAEVRSAAASLLGHYLPLTPTLRLQPDDVLAGVASWASECFQVSIPTIKRFPRKFADAYEEHVRSGKLKGLYVDGLKLPGPSYLGKAKSKNRSVWEGANERRRKPKRWY